MSLPRSVPRSKQAEQSACPAPHNIASFYIPHMTHRPLDPELRGFFSSAPIPECSDRYKELMGTLPCQHFFLLRLIIGARTAYGSAYDPDRTPAPADKKPDKNLVALYQSLTIEQCLQLYGQQHDNIDRKTRASILSVIGAKVIYGKDYVPNLRSTP